jgi:serine protease
VAGTIGSGTDVDVFKVSVGAGQTLTARLIGNVASNYDLALLNGTGAVAKSSVRGAGMADSLSWTNPNGTAVDRWLRVKRVSGSTGVTGTYTLEVAR